MSREDLIVEINNALTSLKQFSAKFSQIDQSGQSVTGQLMATVFSQLAGLLRSGVPLLRSIGVLRDQTSHATLKKILSDVYEHVEQGETLAESMSRHQRVFSEISINMVRAGGEGGFLEDALERIAQFTEQQEDLKGRTVGALAYPAFLAVVGSSVVGGLIVFFVPKFGALFDNLRERGELPAATEWLLWLSETIRSYGLILIVAAVISGAMGEWADTADRKSTRLNSSHVALSRMPSSA